MDQVVITGGTRGLGHALAEEFLRKGFSVSLTGRSQNAVNIAVDKLISSTGNKECFGYVSDVSVQEDIEALWEATTKKNPVHIWINNAGINHINHPFHELDPNLIGKVIDTNVKGTVLASRIAIEGMMNQGFGYLYNMEGFGSDGRKMNGMSIYGTSKNAVRYFTQALIKEYNNADLKIGTISPGMLVTDMLLEPLQKDPHENLRALKVFHILADPLDRVAPWLALKIIENKKHGTHIAWLTRGKITLRFISSMFKKRKVKGLPDY